MSIIYAVNSARQWRKPYTVSLCDCACSVTKLTTCADSNEIWLSP